MTPQKEKVCERVYLTFPKELVREPIVCILAKQFDIMFNIRGSTVTAEMGLVALEIDGSPRSRESIPLPRAPVLPVKNSRDSLAGPSCPGEVFHPRSAAPSKRDVGCGTLAGRQAGSALRGSRRRRDRATPLSGFLP
ncbi:MAG: NIL domain-containing protein [Deltaproteobacteria bacterium]|nr:NIL domain-containing protein [Deltaproteobacteria bacterium]